MSSSSNGGGGGGPGPGSCPGFRAHSINPNRCRRCFKDISEHHQEDDATTGPATKGRVQRTGSLKSNDSADAAAATAAASASVSYTLKPKRVQFQTEKKNDGKEGESKDDMEDNDNDTNDDSPVDVAFTVCVKGSKVIEQPSPPGPVSNNINNNNKKLPSNQLQQDYQWRIKELNQELTKSKEKIDLLERKNKELDSRVDNKESIKKNFDENMKLKQRINDLEQENKSLKNEKKTLEDKVKCGNIKKNNNGNDNGQEIRELKAKLAASEKMVAALTQENEDIKKDVKELEIEFQELHDNFREDQSSEFRVVKHELEAMSKHCRVLQFKLKKAERTIEQMENEKLDMQKQVQELYETSRMDVDKRKMKELENELSIAKEVSLKLHAEIETLKEEQRLIQLPEVDVSGGGKNQPTKKINNNIGNNNKSSNLERPPHFGKLSPSPSLDQSNKDYEQVVRDLYDTMEREKDLQEQLKFSEEETRTMRKKLSTLEQENEILMLQIRKMTSKTNQPKDDEDMDDDDEEELNPEEMKLHLELYEQEMIVLRRKTDELEQENENFQQEIKYLQDKLISQPITKMEIPEIPAGSPANVIYDHKIKILETEARELRKKLVDKEKENESLRTEVELHRRRASKVINRTRSLDSEAQTLDMKKQLQLFEQEANILRQKLIALESDNEKLSNENKRFQLRISKKPPPGPVDQLQLENIELKDKIRELERKCDSLKTDLMNTKLNETTQTETDFIANLKKQLRTKETDLANLGRKFTQMDIELAKINREYRKLKEALAPRRRVNRVIRETATRLELKEIIKEMEEEMQELQTNIRGKDAIIENLTEEVSELKRTIQEMEQKQNGETATNETTTEVAELKRRLEEEQHRCRTLQEKLQDKLTNNKQNGDSNRSIEMLKAENKEYQLRIEELELELQTAKSKMVELKDKSDIFNRNNDELNGVNTNLRQQTERLEDELNEMAKKLKNADKREKELAKMVEENKRELERVLNLNKQLKIEVESSSGGTNKSSSSSSSSSSNCNDGGGNPKTTLLQKECSELKRKLEESRMTINELESQIENQKSEFKEKESKAREEFNQKMEMTSKKIRKEVHLELQALREECTAYKTRCTELTVKLEKAEKDGKELNEKLKTNHIQVRKEREEMLERIEGLETQTKNEQRKREKLEKELENAARGKEEDLLRAQEKIVQLEREMRRYQARMEDVEYDYTTRLNSSEKELNKLKQDYEDLTSKYEMLEKDYVDLKSRSVTEKETLVEAVSSLKKSYEDKLAEIKLLKENSMSQRKEWYQEKLAFQERIADLESKLNKANLVEEERNRLKVLIGEKENLLNSYRKEDRSHNEEREKNRIKIETLQNRVIELERVERNTRFMSITGRAQVDKELQDYRIRLEHSETSHKGELAALHAEYEGRMRLLGEEVEHLQQQVALLAQERDRYRESLEKNAKDRNHMKGSLRDEVEDINSQLRIVRTDLEGALLENRNLKIQHGTEKSTWQIQLAEYKTQINQLEERILLETRGSTRNYARTKMELAWEKERQENLRLLQETQKFIQELRDKLLNTEGLRDKEREEARKQLFDLKTNMDREHVETQQKIAELQFDLLALKETHARLKSQNERLKRERAEFDKAKTIFITDEMTELSKILDVAQKSMAAKTNSAAGTRISPVAAAAAAEERDKKLVEAINQLQQRLQQRYTELVQEARARSTGSQLSLHNGKMAGAGSSTSLSSTALPPPNAVKRAPPRLKMNKKSLSLDQQLRDGASQERIWDSENSLNSTPNSSVSNLRMGATRYGYAGYESDSSGSSFYLPSTNALRLRAGFAKENSFAGSDSDTSAVSLPNQAPKKTLRDKFKIKRPSKSSTDEATLNSKLVLQGFEQSPIELAKQREKKEKSLRYKISKTLSKTFSRSTSVIPETVPEHPGEQHQVGRTATSSSSSSRTKSPTRSKSPEMKKPNTAITGMATATTTTRVPGSTTGTGTTDVVIPGIAQLRLRPVQSNLAIPPSKRPSPPKIRIRTETNV